MISIQKSREKIDDTAGVSIAGRPSGNGKSRSAVKPHPAVMQQSPEKEVSRGDRIAEVPVKSFSSVKAAVAQRVDKDKLHQTYAGFIGEAVQKLTGHIGFGASPEREANFDADHWEKIEHDKYKFALKAKGKVSDAIQAMFDHPEKWSFDCAEFVQVVNFYAAMKTYGAGYADEKQKKNGAFILSQHSSTLFNLNKEAEFVAKEDDPINFERKGRDGKFDLIVNKKRGFVEKFIDEDTLLANLPVGARVMFKNELGKDTPFRNENCVVDGPGTLAAHPMGRGLRPIDIVNKLKEYNQRTFKEDGAEGIYLSQVTIFSTITIPDTIHQKLGTGAYVRAGYIVEETRSEGAAGQDQKCYLTTACIRARGLPDDCEELQVLRQFRDNYLLRRANGPELVKLYYDHAPAIVAAISRRKNAKRIYDDLYQMITRCVRAIKKGRNQDAFRIYCRMVILLKGKYTRH